MKIFKHRGDVYLPKPKFKSDMEQRALIIALISVVVFTSVFLLIVGIKNDFSIMKFFQPENVNVSVGTDAEELPEVQGKANFIFTLNNENTDELYFCTLIQVDLDTVSYKACTLDPNTNVEGKSLAEIYLKGGAGNVMNAVSQHLGISIDYYIDMNTDDFRKMYDSMGKVKYMVLDDVKYKDTSYYGFNIKLKAGEQNIDGGKATDLMRYYIVKEKNYEAVNDIFLASLSQQINEANYEKKEKLFSSFIDLSKTNITVKNFTENLNGMKVLSSETTGVIIYSAAPQYDGNNLTSGSIANIKGYFSK